MSSIMIDTIKSLGKVKHAVGNLNNWRVEDLNLGAIVVEKAMDNFTLGELGFDEKGNRTVKPLSANTVKGVLVASSEDYIKEFETISAFYNGIGDRARILKLVSMKRIDVSNFEGEVEIASKAIKNGQKVHYDATKKKYIVSNNGADHADYATAVNKFVVVNAEVGELDGQSLIRIEVVE